MIASRWQNFDDIIEENISGISYEFDNVKDLIRVLEETKNNPNKILNMKKNCLAKSKAYSPYEVIKKIVL